MIWNLKTGLIAGAVALAMLGGAFAYGVHKGTVWQVQRQEDERTKTQEEIFDLNEELLKKAAELEQLENERRELINDLENQALTAEGSNGPGVGTTGGLRRLEQRWSQSPVSAR